MQLCSEMRLQFMFARIRKYDLVSEERFVHLTGSPPCGVT